MLINPRDRSNFFQGLLILLGKEKKLTQDESEMLMQIAKSLGFNSEYADNAIKDFLRNKFIIEDPPVFSDCNFAEIFIRDGMKLALADKILNFDQIDWLSKTALKNNLSKQWVFIELESLLDNYNTRAERHFDIQKYVDPLYNTNSFAN
jgi:hypothetical protein